MSADPAARPDPAPAGRFRRLVDRIGRVIGPALIDRIDRDHRQTARAFLRRRLVAGATLVVGAVLLGVSLNVPPDAPAFYPLTIALALTWAVGGILSGPLHLGWTTDRSGERRRPVVPPILLGLGIGLVFVAGALVVREVEPLRAATEGILEQARERPLAAVAVVTAVNGIAEEMFFRGALYAAVGVRHAVLVSTVIYTLTTVATGNFMLVFAAAVLGLVVGLQRRASGGILGPILTHVTWSMTMLFVLPPLFSAAGG
ncbi:CPBP family intramembrane glutamic endopeptidase [Nakamurella leprariae]|uniref:CPBP family intramembrane metalloprotease n=1 Tax=Nakamurella leprariae TaxID=2803911 RepID=A0A939BYI3_9ACTN|nr:CPBP family intramembrane glutamic endopeptidase [Nakamurella leprariae]MBM9469583.1 CPBP family intramembrane metalloprotease [Nakamurella leprariae]